MPKVDRRRSYSRHLNYRRSVESIASNETEAYSSEEEQILINPDTDIDHNNFSGESVLSDIILTGSKKSDFVPTPRKIHHSKELEKLNKMI